MNKSNGPALTPDDFFDNAAPVNIPIISHRMPARNPSLAVLVIKAIHDPSVDRSSRDKKKPKYKEFGMVRKQTIYTRDGLGSAGERHLVLG